MTVCQKMSLLITAAGFSASLIFSCIILWIMIEQPFRIIDSDLDAKGSRATVSVIIPREQILLGQDDKNEVTGDQSDNELIVTVTNAGPGVTEAETDKVFEQFSEWNSPAHFSTEDPGLGLAIFAGVPTSSTTVSAW